MVQDQIRYDILVQDALRGVIRKVLTEVAKAGLPGEHHFFITFLTNAPGVKVSTRLKERYADHMTIVLQHQFWDLIVSDDHFEVSLSFGDIPEKLVVPFAAVQVFYDPTAAFEAAFDLPDFAPESDNDSVEEIIPDINEKTAKPKRETKKTAKSKQKAAKDDTKQKAEDDDKPSADVVSLDAFRKNK